MKKTMKPIQPDDVFYIKLGKSGEFEKECIEEKGTLRLGFHEATHQACLDGQWEQVRQEMKPTAESEGAATDFVRQIRTFYKSSDKVLWVTFYKNALWWCFARPEITQEQGNHKTRPAIDGWKNTDIHDRLLWMDQLSEPLVDMRRYHGTICRVKQKDYLLNKINGRQSSAAREAEDALKNLEAKVAALLPTLAAQDSEALIQRAAAASKTSGAEVPGAEIKLLPSTDIARLAVRYGLARWIIDKAR